MSGSSGGRTAARFTFEYNQRGHQVYRVIEVDAATGAGARRDLGGAEDVLRLPARDGSQSDSGRDVPHDVADGREVIWMSERDGWNHLYLYRRRDRAR